jgi:hypothetical protein
VEHGHHHHHHIYFGIAHLEMNDSNKFMQERQEKKHHLLNRKVTRKWQWWLDEHYHVSPFVLAISHFKHIIHFLIYTQKLKNFEMGPGRNERAFLRAVEKSLLN